MPIISIPIERLIHGNQHWRSYHAVDEIEIYCDLLENLQDTIESLETRGKDEEGALINVRTVISSYAFEIAMKSLWALDNSAKPVRHTHNLLTIFGELKEDTIKSLERLHLTTEVLENCPEPFFSNRYSMEVKGSDKDITVYTPPFLRSLIQLLNDKLEESRESILKPPGAPTT